MTLTDNTARLTVPIRETAIGEGVLDSGRTVAKLIWIKTFVPARGQYV